MFYAVGEDSAKRTLGIAGAAALDGNGNVTGGEQDYDNADGIAGNNTPEQANADAFESGGTYTVGSDGRGTLTVSVANTTEGASGKETFSITVVNSKHALITEFDGSATSSGSLDFQTPPPNGGTSYSVQDIAGPYSFAVTGFTRLYAYSQGGVFTLCAGPGAPTNSCAATGDIVNSVTDFNESDGSVTINTNIVHPNTMTGIENYPTAFAPGCATLNGGTALPGCGQAPDKFGRGTANYGGIFWSYYVIGPEVMRLLGCDGDIDGKGTGSGALDNLYIGSAYGQGVKNAGTFTTASLNGSYVIKDASVFPDSSLNGTTPANADVYFAAAGMLSAQNGAVSGFLDASSSSTASFAPAYNKGQAVANATFNVQSPTQGTGGNGILSLPAANTAGISVIGVYFVDPNLNILDPNNTTSGLGGALIVNLDATNLGDGILIPQGTVSTPLQGNFAWLQQSFNASGEQDAVGQFVIAANNGISGTAYVNDLLNTKQTPAAALTGNLTADPSHAGRFAVTITTSLSGSQTTYTLVLYQIGSLGYAVVQTDASQLGTGTLQIQ